MYTHSQPYNTIRYHTITHLELVKLNNNNLASGTQFHTIEFLEMGWSVINFDLLWSNHWQPICREKSCDSGADCRIEHELEPKCRIWANLSESVLTPSFLCHFTLSFYRVRLGWRRIRQLGLINIIHLMLKNTSPATPWVLYFYFSIWFVSLCPSNVVANWPFCSDYLTFLPT